jgi:hypothetical protein
MTKLKISFEITDNWDIEGFRNFIKMLLSEDANYEVYIISNDDSAINITTVGTNLGLDQSNIIICNFTQDKVNAIDNNNIDIHFDNLQSFILLVDELTEAYGILVTPNLNKFYLTPDYVVTFNNLVKRLTSNENEC